MSSESLESVQKEWREIVLAKLSKLETDVTQLTHQVTDIRIAQVSQKEIERFEKLVGEQDERITVLEGAKTQIYSIFFTIQVVIGVIWAVILALKKWQ